MFKIELLWHNLQWLICHKTKPNQTWFVAWSKNTVVFLLLVFSCFLELIHNHTKGQLYFHLPPISLTIQVRWTRLVGHCWGTKNELISDVLLWTLKWHGYASVGLPAKTYISSVWTWGTVWRTYPGQWLTRMDGD